MSKLFECTMCHAQVECERIPKIKLCSKCILLRKIAKKCRDCDNIIEVPPYSKIVLCDKCKKHSLKNHFSMKEKKHFCKKCGVFLFSRMHKGSKVKDDYTSLVCNECNKHNNIETFDRLYLCSKCNSVYIKKIKCTYQANDSILIKNYICDKCNKKTVYILNDENIIQKCTIEYTNIIKVSKQLLDLDKNIQNLLIVLFNVTNTIKKIEKHIQRIRENALYIKDNYIFMDPEYNSAINENIKKLTLQNISYRMKINNPMKNQDTVNKMKTTLMYKLSTRQLIYKKGKDHHLYKGNRAFSKRCRDLLYDSWIFPILQRDNFKCTKCSSTKTLQVHHIVPLHEIIRNVLRKNKINPKCITFTQQQYAEIFDKLVSEVLALHTLDIGITVCKACHEKIDYLYRPYKNEKK